ncbi:hypothetical protein LFWB_3980 [Candidatus Phytoplasma luffae]|uniref:Uncharacterized protein n=1 Tax=Loofah witches'-broom phytoplasma TaxID=35773 RepID=A0A975FJC8_LOWBP|nr:hypothetical protein LFWB_3670 [Candidatus Phytoplasma luffae]QTX02964.1 hypothetical protein LFWB_3980 [Candidatus Phytoplasma luffae]
MEYIKKNKNFDKKYFQKINKLVYDKSLISDIKEIKQIFDFVRLSEIPKIPDKKTRILTKL